MIWLCDASNLDLTTCTPNYLSKISGDATCSIWAKYNLIWARITLQVHDLRNTNKMSQYEFEAFLFAYFCCCFIGTLTIQIQNQESKITRYYIGIAHDII